MHDQNEMFVEARFPGCGDAPPLGANSSSQMEHNQAITQNWYPQPDPQTAGDFDSVLAAIPDVIPFMWDSSNEEGIPTTCIIEGGLTFNVANVNDAPENMSRTSSTKSNSESSQTTQKGSTRRSSNSSVSRARSVSIAAKKNNNPEKDQSQQTPNKEESRHDVLLSKNRLAASKCRQQKKEWAEDLQETLSILETQHSVMQMEYNRLREEATLLKHDLLSHAFCNDPRIDQWIQNEAEIFVTNRKSNGVDSMV
ncbi:hypothetical protein BGZ63DRAFT_377635 [Mariannaea sp. PMI_226]|nr:hypothetical protein BGZ63DRAFT_377635 [Mariannaea sp. PMI_226]